MALRTLLTANLNAATRAVRAIGVVFARRTIRPFVIIGAVVLVGLLGLGGWLASNNAWWWLLEAVFIVATLLFAGLVIAVHWLLRRVAPPMSRSQRQAVEAFVDKLERVAEHLQTPQFMIVYYVIRDTLRPRPGGFITQVTHDSRTLHSDFAKLQRLLQ
jgi:NADH:ubiquinone oxidoreductase subunit 6 (subunit J)